MLEIVSKNSIRKCAAEIRLLLRFFFVSCCCGAVDAFVGLMSFNWGGLSLFPSTIAGVVAGGIVGYILHEVWTFKSGKRFLLPRFLSFCSSATFLLLLRWGLIWVYEQYALPQIPLAEHVLAGNLMYIVSLGFSFVTNYCICRLFIWKSAITQR